MGQWDSGVGHCIAWSMDILWIWWPWYFHPGNSKEWSGIRRDIKSNWGVSRVVVTRKVMLCWFIVITIQRLVSHLQENNVCIFLAQWRMFLVHLHLYLYSGSKLLAGQRWSPMLKSICCNCPTCDCYCIAGKDRPGGVGLYKGQQFSIDKRKVVGMQKWFIQNYKLPKTSIHPNQYKSTPQGLLVDLSKKAMITGNYKELDDAIRLKIPK